MGNRRGMGDVVDKESIETMRAVWDLYESKIKPLVPHTGKCKVELDNI